jgi:hypothetical protein
MKTNWKALLAHPFVNMIVAAGVGGAVSLAVALLTIAPGQDRQMRLEQLTEFATSADDVVGLGTEFVAKLNIQQDLGETKLAIGRASTKQAIAAESLVDIFGPSIADEARGYQSALIAFVESTNRLESPEQIRDWVVKFDELRIAQRNLKTSMRGVLQIAQLNN